VATAPKKVVDRGQVKDQAPAARRVLELAAKIHVAAPLAYACRYAVLRADCVSGRAEQRPLFRESKRTKQGMVKVKAGAGW